MNVETWKHLQPEIKIGMDQDGALSWIIKTRRFKGKCDMGHPHSSTSTYVGMDLLELLVQAKEAEDGKVVREPISSDPGLQRTG